MTVLALLLALLWLAMVWGVGRWGQDHRLQPATPAVPAAVHVVVPARNEARVIQGCVTALTGQTHRPLRITVVDDGSDDGTAELARRAVLASPGDVLFEVIAATDRPAGWSGKAWACRTGAEGAEEPVLLFVDSDVRLEPRAVATLVHSLAQAPGLVSVFGTWELVTFWERVAIPAIGWFIRGATDLDRVADPSSPDAFANGQCIAITAEAYASVGGHEAVKGEVLDDVRLAQAVKAEGGAVRVAWAPWLFRVRLYHSLGEIVAGYRKNLYEGMDRKAGVALAAVGFVAVAGVLPAAVWLVLLPGALAQGPSPGFAAWSAVVVLQMIFRFRIERRDGRTGAMAWSHPLANGVLLLALVLSWLGPTVSWKGRRFVDGQVDEPG